MSTRLVRVLLVLGLFPVWAFINGQAHANEIQVESSTIELDTRLRTLISRGRSISLAQALVEVGEGREVGLAFLASESRPKRSHWMVGQGDAIAIASGRIEREWREGEELYGSAAEFDPVSSWIGGVGPVPKPGAIGRRKLSLGGGKAEVWEIRELKKVELKLVSVQAGEFAVWAFTEEVSWSGSNVKREGTTWVDIFHRDVLYLESPHFGGAARTRFELVSRGINK